MTSNDREIILNGNNGVYHLCNEEHVAIYAGQDLTQGSLLVDMEHRRAYEISTIDSSSVVVTELVLSRGTYQGTNTLDSPLVVGMLTEDDVHLIIRK